MVQDHGMDGLSTCIAPCVKLWVLYPPSNLDRIYTCEGQEGKFVRLFDQLQGGLYVITTAKDALYIPSGWAHAVLTLTGGLLPGLNWSTAQSVTIAAQVFGHEYASRSCTYDNAVPFLHSCIAALRTRNDGLDKAAVEQWCRLRTRVVELGRRRKTEEGQQWPTEDVEILYKLLQKREGACAVCGRTMRDHGPRGPLKSRDASVKLLGKGKAEVNATKNSSIVLSRKRLRSATTLEGSHRTGS